MRLIRPDASMDVPRGTLRQIWRQPCDPVHHEAVAARLRWQMRIPFTAANCHLERGAFDSLDLARGTPEGTGPANWRGLNARMRAGAVMRSVTVHSAANVGDVMFCGPPTLRVHDATESMLMIAIRPERLRSISDEEALAEGVEWWAIKANNGDAPARGQTRSDAYRALLGELRARTRNRWQRTEEHAHAEAGNVSPRSLFILDWARVHGYQSWLLNPWVWVVSFQLELVRPIELVRRLEAKRRSA